MIESTLVLLPNVLDEMQPHEAILPLAVADAVQGLDGLIAESEKGGRKFLMRFLNGEEKSFRNIPIRLLNEHSEGEDIGDLIAEVEKGGRWGLISDCGLPCVADPGAHLVKEAHKRSIPVEVIPGPSSIFMALMLSGIASQSFTFNGYLPRKPEMIRPVLHQHQKNSGIQRQTNIYIEAPYRSKKALQYLISYLAPDTELSIAWNISMPTQGVMTKTIQEWKTAALPEIDKSPAVFLFRAAPIKTERELHKKKQPGRFYDPRKKRGGQQRPSHFSRNKG